MGLFKNARLHKSPHKPDHERKISAVDAQPEDFDNYTNRIVLTTDRRSSMASIAIEEDKKCPAAQDSQSQLKQSVPDFTMSLLTRPEGKGNVESSLPNAN